MAAKGRSLSLVGIKEAAALIGWSRQKTSVYYRRGLLPPPAAQLACGPIWLKEDIARFARREEAQRAPAGSVPTQEPAPRPPSFQVFSTRVPLEGWEEAPTLYWTHEGQYVLWDGVRQVVSSHLVPYYEACLRAGIVSFSRRVVDVDAVMRSIVKRGAEHAQRRMGRLQEVEVLRARSVMQELGWFSPSGPRAVRG